MDFDDVKIICDSINSVTGKRITTFQVSLWKLLLAEWNTHRQFSRNAASSRAVPAKKMREMVLKTPFMPVHWGKNQKGMQAQEELSGIHLIIAKLIWKLTSRAVCLSHWTLEKIGLHKQVCNRLIEPWLAANVVVTATDFENFFKLRDHADAQPEISDIARKMHILYDQSVPQVLHPGEWHIPYILPDEEELEVIEKVRISAGRCARVSYYYHDGQRSKWEQDLNICKRLMASEPQHASPFEHQAMAYTEDTKSGNFSGGWIQHRKLVEVGIEPYGTWN